MFIRGLSLVELHYYIILLTYEHLYMFPSVVDYLHVLLVVAHKERSVTRQTTNKRENCVFFPMLCASSWSFNNRKHNRLHKLIFSKNKQIHNANINNFLMEFLQNTCLWNL